MQFTLQSHASVAISDGSGKRLADAGGGAHSDIRVQDTG